jgi:hypothetical protein
VLIVCVSNYGFLSFIGLDLICRSGGLIGAITMVALQNMLQYLKKHVKIPDDMDWELALRLSVTADESDLAFDLAIQ